MLKRSFDFVFSFFGLLILSPLFLVVSILIVIDSRGGVFFRQERVGQFGRIFRIHKFRTMVVDSESKGRITIGADPRITHIGQFLRKYKLDELPQLYDVFVGDMSLVGPRPEVVEYMAKYPDDAREKILSVKPGITDLASIEMIDENILLQSYSDPVQAYVDVILPIKQDYYLRYVAEHNLFFDVKIIFLTIGKVIFR